MSTVIDLSRMPTPQIIEEVAFETIRDAMLADLQARDPAFTAVVPSDPIYKQIEVCAYRELLLRQQFNDRAKGLLLAFSTGSDLDHIGVTYYKAARLVVDAGNPNAIPPIPPTYESDADYRSRLLIAEDAFSTAGPATAYIYYAKSASGDVKDVSVVSPTFQRLTLTAEQQAVLPAGTVAYSVVDSCGLTDPTPASVVVTVLSRIGVGIPDTDLLTAVEAALTDDVRPLTDEVIVRAADIVPYTINATLILYEGVNQAYTRSVAEAALQSYVDRHHELGHPPTTLGVRAAMKVPGVHDVILNAVLGTDMVTSLVVPKTAAAYCDGMIVTVGA